MSNSYTNCGWLWKNRLYGSWMVLKRYDWLRQVLKMSRIITVSYSAKSTLISWTVLSWITSVATERPSAIAWSNVISREAIPWSPASANPHKFYPGGSDKLRPTEALFIQVSLSSKHVERDMANFVKTELQLYNSRGNWVCCLSGEPITIWCQ